MSYVHIGLYNTLRSLGATEDQAQAAVVDLPKERRSPLVGMIH